MFVHDLFNLIYSISENYDGITVSGGEPFEQYEQLISFLYLIKNHTSLDVQCYTGFTLEEINENHKDGLFAEYIDVLIDGRYDFTKHDDGNIKGSSNQSVYKFADGIATPYNPETPSKWSLRVDSNMEIYMTGIPRRNELMKLETELFGKGFKSKFY